jgi:hypothetical protein
MCRHDKPQEVINQKSVGTFVKSTLYIGIESTTNRTTVKRLTLASGQNVCEQKHLNHAQVH